jgi:hypothetical protein
MVRISAISDPRLALEKCRAGPGRLHLRAYQTPPTATRKAAAELPDQLLGAAADALRTWTKVSHMARA